ncbi:hypothetical protein PGT21_002460 [Puccinia graminis f. sp. tritici]|uniref:Uncharacterized protein n=1 Tax=Puccinia graminis f. sp. tritici TaxID=56615 RepID=A0A5B0QAC1_PUCGR|nr:hypothetical protein PGT21_002460 [Puccinia graminis f. sp. tritici]
MLAFAITDQVKTLMSVQSYVVLQPDCGATKFSFLWPGAIEHILMDGAHCICVKRNEGDLSLSRIILCCRGFYRVHCRRNKLASPSLTCAHLHIDDKARRGRSDCSRTPGVVQASDPDDRQLFALASWQGALETRPCQVHHQTCSRRRSLAEAIALPSTHTEIGIGVFACQGVSAEAECLRSDNPSSLVYTSFPSKAVWATPPKHLRSLPWPLPEY